MQRLVGITHHADGSPIIREVRTTKVGIGVPAGKAIDVLIDPAGKWAVRVGMGRDAKVERFETMEEAQSFYRKAKANAPDRKYPQRLSYFTFTRIGADGLFEPDWQAIQEHGSLPTEVDIVFTKDDPLQAKYEYWTSAELKCSGDGVNGMRVNSMAEGPEEEALARAAEQRGERYFPITEGCYTLGCPYSRAIDDRHPAPCRPHGRLVFQLVHAPRFGATAYYDTTGRRSISNLFSGIMEFRSVTGNGDPDRGFIAGIPFKLVLRPYKTSHNGKPAIQYGVGLEFRAESALEAKRMLIEHGVRFRNLIAEPSKLEELEASTTPKELVASTEDLLNPVIDMDTGELLGNGGEVPPAAAEQLAAEFYPPQQEDDSPDDDDFGASIAPPVAMPRRKSKGA